MPSDQSHTTVHVHTTKEPTLSRQHSLANDPRFSVLYSATHIKPHTTAHKTSHTSHHTATHVVSYTTTSSAAGTSSFSYPTPTNIPHSSTIVMGLSLTVAFLSILLIFAVLLFFIARRKAARRDDGGNRSEYGLNRLESKSDQVQLKEPEPAHRTWRGRKIVHLLPGEQI